MESAAVGRARVPRHEAVSLEAVDRACHSALREERPGGEIGWADTGLGTSSDLHEEKVLPEGQAAPAVSESLERMRCGRVGAQEGLPAGLLGLAQAPLALRGNRLRRQPVDCSIN